MTIPLKIACPAELELVVTPLSGCMCAVGAAYRVDHLSRPRYSPVTPLSPSRCRPRVSASSLRRRGVGRSCFGVGCVDAIPVSSKGRYGAGRAVPGAKAEWPQWVDSGFRGATFETSWRLSKPPDFRPKIAVVSGRDAHF